MDANSAQVASEPLKYQIWFLKVSIHCEGCRRKVKKVLKSIDGVFTTTIDLKQQKVTVIGSVGVETLIRKLIKAGKHAEIWPENLTGKGKSSGQGKKMNEQKYPENGGKNESNLNSEKNRGDESAANWDDESKSKHTKPGGNSPDMSPTGDQVQAADHKGGQGDGATGTSGGGGSGKKKKKKKKKAPSGGGSGGNALGTANSGAPGHPGLQSSGQVVGPEMGHMNLSPTRQQPYPYQDGYDPHMVNLAAYTRFYPIGRMGGPSYYVLPLQYTFAGLGQGINHCQSAPLSPFEIFSDENANGCFIM